MFFEGFNVKDEIMKQQNNVFYDNPILNLSVEPGKKAQNAHIEYIFIYM